MMPKDAFLVDQTITSMLDTESTEFLPSDMYSVDETTSEIIYPTYEHIKLSSCDACELVPPAIEFDPYGVPLPPDPTASSTYEYIEVMEPAIVYVVSCDDPMDQLILPDPELQPVLQSVAVISECRIQGRSDMRLDGVALASLAMGGGTKGYEKATVHFPSGTYFGAQDFCAPGGGVQIYTSASVHISASAEINGMRIVAGGDVELAANMTANGLSIEAGHNIRYSANGNIGTGCTGDQEGVFAWHYRLVR